MGIQITDAESAPAIVYDRVHVTKLEILQPTFLDDTATAVYQVIINFRYYGVVNGVRFYKVEEPNRVAIDDFISTAMIKAGAGDMTLITALQNIEAATASIIGDQTSRVTSIV